MSLLQELRAEGFDLRQGEEDRLYLRGPIGVELGPHVQKAKARKPELLAELAAEAAAADALYACPGCHGFDYEPLGDDRRRCLNQRRLVGGGRIRCDRIYYDHDDVRPAPPPAPAGCRLHRDAAGEIRYGGGGSLGCARHLRTLTASGRCPASGELVTDIPRMEKN